MHNSTHATDRFLFGLCGLTFGIPALFFGYLTIRLVYLVLTAENGDMYLTFETILATVGFPGMFLLLISLARYFFRKAVARPLN